MKLVICYLGILLLPACAIAQKTSIVDSTDPNYRTVIAGKQYDRSSFHNFLWGKHYRKEWTTPVKVPIINLDTIAGGLTVVEQGGGRQTKTLRLKNPKGKQYVLRSVDKSYTGALPDIAAGSFIESIANDQVSTAHPFAAIAIPKMIEAAGVYHTNPIIVFVPYTPSLGIYNNNFANTLCLFEERADEDQSDAPNFGYSKDVVGTEKMLENIREENDHVVDQPAFVRARLFDIFLGDWGRHEDQWRWAKFKKDDKTVYRPIPRDRDQTWTLYDGLMLKVATSLADLDHLRSFDDKIKEIETYNFPARNLDRRLTNEVPRQTWLDIAKDLQKRLTDAVIESSIRQLPPELFSISGNTIIQNLKRRRDDLVIYATQYYDFISKEVDIPGSENAEFFEVLRINDNESTINIYDLDKEGRPRGKPFYSRAFSRKETEEIRIYGLKGNDIYRLKGNANDIKLRIVGGTDKDVVVNETGSTARVKYYDNPGNDVNGKIKTLTSRDTAINNYTYNSFKHDKQGFIFLPYYTNRRGFFWNLGYKYTKQQWRKQPFGWSQVLKGYYSFTNNSFGADYVATFNELFGKWNFLVSAHYDQKLDNHFFGIGNETTNDTAKSYYTYFSKETGGVLDLNTRPGKFTEFGVRGIYEMIKILDNEPSYFSSHLPDNDKTLYSSKHFAGAEVYFNFRKENDEVVPTKGILIGGTANYIQNLKDKDKNINRYTGVFGFYLPFSRAISWASRSGIATVTGEPEFYQLATLGGAALLRGFTRQRFHGETAAYTNNDLRWIFKVRSFLFNGKMGLIGFADNGRVWQTGEDSDDWHFAYGGGIMISPFNLGAFTIYYSISEEARLIQFRLRRFF